MENTGPKVEEHLVRVGERNDETGRHSSHQAGFSLKRGFEGIHGCTTPRCRRRAAIGGVAGSVEVNPRNNSMRARSISTTCCFDRWSMSGS